MTVTPAAAKRGASSRDDVAPAENRAMSRPGRVGDGGVLDGDLAVAPRQRRARRARRGEVAQLVDGEAPLGEQPAHHAADLSGCTDDSDTHGDQANDAPRRARRAGYFTVATSHQWLRLMLTSCAEATLRTPHTGGVPRRVAPDHDVASGGPGSGP